MKLDFEKARRRLEDERAILQHKLSEAERKLKTLKDAEVIALEMNGDIEETESHLAVDPVIPDQTDYSQMTQRNAVKDVLARTARLLDAKTVAQELQKHGSRFKSKNPANSILVLLHQLSKNENEGVQKVKRDGRAFFQLSERLYNEEEQAEKIQR